MLWMAWMTAVAWTMDCSDLEKAQLRLQVHASNLSLAGGASEGDGRRHPQRVDCSTSTCRVFSEERTLRRYDPTSPLADSEGYVSEVVVNVVKERSAAKAAASELRLLARASVCRHAKIEIETPAQLVIRIQNEKSPVAVETLRFSGRNEVSGWSRTYRDGQQESVEF